MTWNGDWYAHHDDYCPAEDEPVFHGYTYKYEFDTDEELIKSPVFQRCLAQSLAFKDRIIADLQRELMFRGEQDDN